MIVGLFPGLLGHGGVQQAGRHVAAVLSASAPCHFLSLNDPAGEGRFSIGGTEVRFRGFARAKANFARAALGLALNAPRLVLAAHPHLAPIIRGMKFLHPALRSIVVTHGVEVWRPLGAMRRRSLAGADLVLAPSIPTSRRLVEVQGVSEGRIHRLPWAIDPDFVSGNGDLLPRAFPSSPVVLAVTRLSIRDRYKGVDHLIQLVRELPGIQLAVVGDGDDRSRLEHLAGSDRIRFLGALSLQELRACYRACDVFALPSTAEGFGLVFLEAMAFGKPVIASACGGVLDLIEDGVTGRLVAPGDRQRWSEAIRCLLGDAALREQMGRRAADKASQAYSFEGFHQNLGRLVEDLCAS